MNTTSPCTYCEAHPEELEEYLIGWLDEAAQAAFEAHLTDCVHCQEAVAAHQEQDALFAPLFGAPLCEPTWGESEAFVPVSEAEHADLLVHVFEQVGESDAEEPTAAPLPTRGPWEELRRWLGDLPFFLIPATVTACLFVIVLSPRSDRPLLVPKGQERALSKPRPALRNAPKTTPRTKAPRRVTVQTMHSPSKRRPQVVFGQPSLSQERETTLSFDSMTLAVEIPQKPQPDEDVASEPTLVQAPTVAKQEAPPVESEPEYVLAVQGQSLVKAAEVPLLGQRQLAATASLPHHMTASATSLQKAKSLTEIALVERAGVITAPRLTL